MVTSGKGVVGQEVGVLKRAAMSDSEVKEVIGQVKAVPRRDSDFLFGRPSLGHEEVGRFMRLNGITEKQLESLAGSVSGRDASMALCVSFMRGNTRDLLRIARRSLGNRQVGVPYAEPPTAPGILKLVEQTVGDYAKALVKEWVGVALGHLEADTCVERFDTLIPGQPDFANADQFVLPWRRRLMRTKVARDQAEEADVKTRVLGLGEELRAVVVILGWRDGVYERTEAREILGGLSEGAKRAVGETVTFLPGEPYLRDVEGLREWIRGVFRDLMK